MLYVYVLRLVESKFYVGLSNCVQRRIQEHRAGAGAAWTQKYPPLPHFGAEVHEAENELDEDYTTLKMMLVHGVENVRGGSFSSVRLLPPQVRVLRAIMRSARNVCFECGKPGHQKKNCPEYAASVEKFLKNIRSQTLVVRECVQKKLITLPNVLRPLHPLHFASSVARQPEPLSDEEPGSVE